MTLDRTQLRSDLHTALNLYPASSQTSADNIAGAYYQYALDGEFGSSTPTGLTTAHRDALASDIGAGMSGSLAAFTAAIEDGIKDFWDGVVVDGGSGTGTSVSPINSISGSLYDKLSAFPSTTSDAAKIIRDEMDNLTATTTAVLTLAGSTSTYTIT